MKDIASRPEASGLPSALSSTVKLKPGSVKYTPKDEPGLSRSATDFIPPPELKASTPAVSKSVLMSKSTMSPPHSHSHFHPEESKGTQQDLR